MDCDAYRTCKIIKIDEIIAVCNKVNEIKEISENNFLFVHFPFGFALISLLFSENSNSF